MAGNKDLQKKAHAKLTGHDTRAAAQRESDRANVPVINADAFEKAQKAGALMVDPWEGKTRLGGGPKSLRVEMGETEIEGRRVELGKRIKQTEHLENQVVRDAQTLKDSKARLASHIADYRGYSVVTEQGWEYREVETIEVLEKRPGGYQLAVTYRLDTGAEVSKREATKEELQTSVPGA